MFDFLRPHGLKQAKLPCPSPTSGVCSDSCPSGQWCHRTISFSVIPFSSCLQSFPESRSFPMNQLFASCGQSIETSASSSVLPINIQNWPVWSPCSPRDSQESSPAPHFKSISISVFSFLYGQLLHPYMTTGKNRALTRWTFVSKVMSLFFNMLSRFVIAFLPRRKCLNFVAAITICNDFRAPKIKYLNFFYCFPLLFAMKWWNQMPWS